MPPRNARIRALVPALPLALALVWAPRPSLAEDKLDEVLVQANRNQILQMRRELTHREDQFYQTFNKLNTDNQFDIICDNGAHTGSVFRHRTCRARFEQDANAADFQAWWMGNASIPPAQVIAVKRIEMRKVLIELLTAHPELRAAVTHYHDYKVKYEDMLAKNGLSRTGYAP
jgi:hypothetical protein